MTLQASAEGAGCAQEDFHVNLIQKSLEEKDNVGLGLHCTCADMQEEFMSAYGEQVQLLTRQEEIQTGLEECGEDMERMSELLDELQELNSKAADLDVKRLDKKIDQMMPELGFSPDDNDRLVASYRWGTRPKVSARNLPSALQPAQAPLGDAFLQ